jgi:hypothetical protein
MVMKGRPFLDCQPLKTGKQLFVFEQATNEQPMYMAGLWYAGAILNLMWKLVTIENSDVVEELAQDATCRQA